MSTVGTDIAHMSAQVPTMQLALAKTEFPRIDTSLFSVPALLVVLNLADQVFTLFWVEGGKAVEANVLMKAALDSSPILFAFVKTFLVGMGAFILVRHRHHPLARVGLTAGAVTYGAVVLYHLAFLLQLF